MLLVQFSWGMSSQILSAQLKCGLDLRGEGGLDANGDVEISFVVKPQ